MTAAPFDPGKLPDNLPPPSDDGAAKHLVGLRLPSLPLRATDGGTVDFANLADRTVIYVYPRTGRPGQNPPEGWAGIPGARGCSHQSCSFRDHFDELKKLGVAHVFGLSTQTPNTNVKPLTASICPFPFSPMQTSLSLERSIFRPLL